MKIHLNPITLAMAVIFGATCSHGIAEEVKFNRDIRPILSENCFFCHGQDPEHRGGDLRLDIREEAIATRKDSPPAIIPGDPEASELIKRLITTDPDLSMPPADAHLDGLKKEQIQILRQWIKSGAEYEPHWSFVPPTKATLPQTLPPQNPVDSFIRDRLKSEGLTPSKQAPAGILVRRLYLDLTGLPPSVEDITRYLSDSAPDRWQKLIQELMNSPHFAERLAMPWLDAARYADTHGFSIDDHRDMWAWRDWVINAFQKNQAYDQFLTEQIAGDLIPNATPDQIAATGFLRNNMATHEGGTIEEEYRVIQNLDKVDAVATSILGLTMKCAQCHDHKYDPISQKEFFSFYAFFNSSSEPGKAATNANTPPLMAYTSPLANGGIDGLKSRVTELERFKRYPPENILIARNRWETEQKKSTNGPLAKCLSTGQDARSAADWKIINEAFISSDSPQATKMKIFLKTVEVEIKVLNRDIKRGQTTVMVMDHKPELRKTHILIRGAYDQLGEEVSAGVPSVLPAIGGSESSTRLDLARWITAPENPLTARVAVNRTWQMLFGRGIVETSGDFGNQGSWPSHPELLDWLAVDFVEHDWNIRHTLQTILNSETYRQSAVSSAEHQEKDPRNLLLARSPRPRIAAEIIRDQALAHSGLLNRSVGGPSVHPPQPELWSEVSHYGYTKPFTAQIYLPGQESSAYRRSMYTFWKRTSPPPSMAIFDAPSRETCSVVRSNTNTPLQALVLLNEPQFVKAGLALGHRILLQGGSSHSSRINYGFRLTTGRNPSTQEAQIFEKSILENIQRYSNDPRAAIQLTQSTANTEKEIPLLAAYAILGSTLLNLDESITRP